MGKKLKEALGRGEIVVGMGVYSYSAPVVEAIGHWGFDFALIDTEHTPLAIDQSLEKLILVARLAGVAPFVRVRQVSDVDIRKVLEFGAEGVVIPRVRTKAEAERVVNAAKFIPEGRRGIDPWVRSARYSGPGFDMEKYVTESNRQAFVVPMDEDRAFDDAIDDILSVAGIDAILFGPTDFAFSLGLPVNYRYDLPPIQAALTRLLTKARPKGINVMVPISPVFEVARDLVGRGANMFVLGNDMATFQSGCKTIMSECVEPLRKAK